MTDAHSFIDDALTFSVRVVPRASRTELVRGEDGTPRLRLTAPPVDGEANEEIIRFFSKMFGVPKSAVEMVSGHRSRTKRIRIFGVGVDAAARFEAALSEG